MKSMMNKSTLREIKQSMGRYLAILAIIALGVGFFAGLKATTPAMVKTAQNYWDEKELYDFRLICTLGFGDAEIAEIAKREDVRAVQGAYSFDIICQNTSDGSAQVMKAHSITEGVNELELVSGRLPNADNECVVDARMFSHKYIGKKIKFSVLNTEEDLGNFVYKEYKIVGTVNSPIYSQFERGNTSLGDGTVSGFFYLLPEGFDADAYTEAYVKLDKDFPLYDEDYDTYIEAKTTEWESYMETLGELRYQNVILEFHSELTKARKELKQGKEDGLKELADAKEKLDEAALEIEDGKKELADAKQEIADGLLTLAEEEKKLEDGAREIARNEKLLMDKEKEAEAGMVTWQEGQDSLDAALAEIAKNEATLQVSEAQLKAGEAELAQKEAEVIAGEEQLATLEAALPVLLEKINEYQEKLAELEGLEQSGLLPEEMQQLLTDTRNALDALEKAFQNAQTEIATNRAALEDGKKQLQDAKNQLAGARQQLEDGKQQIASAKQQIADGNAELDDAWTTMMDGKKQIRDGKLELTKGRNEIDKGREALEDARKELEDAQIEIAEAQVELAEGEKEYLDGLAEYEEGLAEFEAEIADAEKKLMEAEEDYAALEMPDQYILDRNTNVGYVCFESDSNIVNRISDVFPVFFFLVAALVCMTTMNRMIEEQRTQIGTLKALGYSRGTIMGKYIFYSGSAALTGCVGGFIIGILLFPYIIWICYGMMYDMGRFYFVFDWKMAVFSLVMALLCSVGVTWYSCRKELSEVAAQLMRPKTPQAGKRIFLERIPFIWKRLKFLQKVSVRNVFRYKKRFLMMVLGISGCTALIIAGFGINDSVSNVVSHQYEEITVYDMSVTLKDAYTETVEGTLNQTLKNKVTSYNVVMEENVDLQLEKGVKSVSLVVPKQTENMQSYIDLHTLDGKAIAYPGKGEAVISHRLNMDYGYEVGDVIELQDSDFRPIKVTVSGIMQNFVGNYVYIHPDTYTEQMGQAAEYKTLYVNLEENPFVDAHEVSATLMKLEDVTAVSVNEDTMDRFESMMASIDYIVLLVILCAAALAFIVIYNLTNINITERIREIATIKVLGFYKNETAAYVFRENILLTVVGSAVGIGLGKLLHWFIMQVLRVELVTFDVRINTISYVYSVLLTFLFAMCVNFMLTGKLEKISMTESLKSVD